MQYNALGHLLTALLKRHDLKPEAVLGHSDIAPDRKIDPGKHFNWRWLEQHGLAAPYVPPTGLKSTTPPLEILAKLGYRATPTDAGVPPASPEAVVAAFQRRYFPEAPVLGKLCPRTEYFIRQGKRK